MASARKANVFSVSGAKTQFADLIDQVMAGEEIVITKHGKPIAKLVPINTKSTVEERRAAIAHFREMSQHITLGGLKIKDLIAEGRR